MRAEWIAVQEAHSKLCPPNAQVQAADGKRSTSVRQIPLACNDWFGATHLQGKASVRLPLIFPAERESPH